MRKLMKKLFVLIIVAILTISNFIPFIPITIVHAEPLETIRLQLDGATVSDNTITFTAGETHVTATVTGNGFSFENGNNGEELVIYIEEINTIKLALSNNFDSSRMSLKLHNDQTLTITGDNEAILDGLDFSIDNSPHLQLVVDESPGGRVDTQNYQGNGNSTLNLTINGVIDYNSGNGYDMGIGFIINGPNDDVQYKMGEPTLSTGPAYERDDNGQIIEDDNHQPIPLYDPETMQQMTETNGLNVEDTINYDYDENTNLVDFTFVMAPGTFMEALTINGDSIELPSTKEELEACYNDHRLEIKAKDIPHSDEYIIEINARYPSSDQEFMGNFLWDYNPVGYTSPEDKILHAKLELVKAVYAENEDPLTSPDEVNDMHGVFIWKDAERKKNYTEEREGVGEAQFPIGTELTVRIIPDSGYQLVDFGINGRNFEPQEEIGTYTFTVQGGPFHLQATIKQVDNVVNTTSEKIKSGEIVLGGEEESMIIGTARLDVEDIDLNEKQISNFEEAAAGYNINNYIDISLYNIVYKGTIVDSWDTEVKNLDNEATITLKIEDGINGNEVVIVHEKHDGTYEIIPIEYDQTNHTITFKTKSFSNYAIASKNKNIETGDNIILFISMLGLCIAGIYLTNSYKKTIKLN